MNLYFNKMSAHEAASAKTLEAAKLSNMPGRSSGNSRLVWKVQPRFKFFYTVVPK